MEIWKVWVMRETAIEILTVAAGFIVMVVLAALWLIGRILIRIVRGIRNTRE